MREINFIYDVKSSGDVKRNEIAVSEDFYCNAIASIRDYIIEIVNNDDELIEDMADTILDGMASKGELQTLLDTDGNLIIEEMEITQVGLFKLMRLFANNGKKRVVVAED